MTGIQSNKNKHLSRRNFTKKLIGGAIGGSAVMACPPLFSQPIRKRRVAVMSDIHIGRRANDLDGQTWFRRSLEDLDGLGNIDYGLALGDITHSGDRKSLMRYLQLRDRSRVGRWFELAGNHEHRNGGIARYRRLVRDLSPYCEIDGNIAWFFLSDEWKRVPGNMTNRSYHWLKENLSRHSDKIIIFCSHQIPPNTTRRSDEDMFCIHPRRKITSLFNRYPITLSLFGHEHHAPYSKACMREKSGTTYINAASTSHAYGTGMSASIILELEDDKSEIVVRRRSHDLKKYQDEFLYKIPLAQRIRLASSG